jgi:citrate lyase subunit beta/citryl-CoA lyase
VKPYRSMLFVPGHKPAWAEKAVAARADAIILDLEDSVPLADKPDVRLIVRQTIERLRLQRLRSDIWVRPNCYDSGLFGDDVEAVIAPGLAGLFLPKVSSAEEIVRIDAVVSHIEAREHLPVGSVGLILTFETAASIAHCEEIAGASPRVSSLLGATGPDADIGRELGFEFTPEGLETLYQRSRIIVAARAAALRHPLTGVWQDLKDLDGFLRFAHASRQLGYRGMVCIHPTHVSISNEVFTPSSEKIDYCRRLITAFHEGEARGDAAVQFEGRHVDYAHVKTAEEVIELAEMMGLQRNDGPQL